MKREKRMSWSKIFKLNNRIFRLFYKRYPQMLLSQLVNVVWTALTPYVGIFLSALIINELAGNRNRERLQLLVLITLVAAAGISLISALLSRWMETQNAGKELKAENILAEKMLDMDYASLDDSHTAELLSTIRQNMYGGGWGLFRGLASYEVLCSSVLTILGGISLTVSLFISRVPERGDSLTVLNEPWVVIGVIVVMVAVTFIAPTLSNKAGSYYAKNADSHTLANRLFSFFGWLGCYRELAPDVRIYRQDKMCDRYNRNKEGTFGSNGVFAHVARGR